MVGLVAAGPVARLLHVGLAQHGEHLLQAFLVDHVAHADKLGVLHRNAHFKVRVENLQHQVIERLSAHLALLDIGDAGRSVVRVHNHFSDLEFHCGSLRR